MAIRTLEEQLEDVQLAIEKCLERQSYSINDRVIQSALLADLTTREEMLLRRMEYRDARQRSGGIRAVRFTA